jgi:hypothetical protein
MVAACGGGGEQPLQLFRGEVLGSNVAVSDGIAYWTTSNPALEIEFVELHAAPVDGSAEPVRLSTGAATTHPGLGMAVGGGRVVWGDNTTVYGDSITGGERTVLTSYLGPTSTFGIAIDGDLIYASGGFELLRIGPAAVDRLTRVDGITAAAGAVFALRDQTLLRLDRDGTETILADNLPVNNRRLIVVDEAAYIATDRGAMRFDFASRALDETAIRGDVAELAHANGMLYAITRDETDALVAVRAAIDDPESEPEIVLPQAGASTLASDGTVVVLAKCSCNPIGGENGQVFVLP